MPYTKSNYPDQIKNLKEGARQAAWKVVKDKYSSNYMKESRKSFKQIFNETAIWESPEKRKKKKEHIEVEDCNAKKD